MDGERVAEYIYHRLKVAGKTSEIFQGKAINRIRDCSEGIPRKINNVCEIALLQGMFEKRAEIDELLIDKVTIREDNTRATSLWCNFHLLILDTEA